MLWSKRKIRKQITKPSLPTLVAHAHTQSHTHTHTHIYIYIRACSRTHTHAQQPIAHQVGVYTIWPHSRRSILTRKEGNVLFNGAFNTFYLRLYGVTHMIKDHSDSERGNPQPQHGLLFPISSNCSFTRIIPQTG